MPNTIEIIPEAISATRVLRHPLLDHSLTRLRDKNTSPQGFRRVMERLSGLMAYEITRELHTRPKPIETPFTAMDGVEIAEDIVIVPIMRAGFGMLEGLLQMIPFAQVGHIGIYRDKFINTTVEYYFRVPNDVSSKRVLLADPLLATGATAVASIDRLKEYQVGPIVFVSLLAAPEGLSALYAAHPDVPVYTLSIEKGLDENGFILPGVGDAGGRLYGTHIHDY